MKFAFPGLSLLFFTWVPIRGESLVIGSSEPMVAVVGDDVILPCHLDPPADVEDLTLEWSRPDLTPDPKDPLNRRYVHLQRNGREMFPMKHPSYYGRTALFKDALKKGNVSLKLTNVTLSDEGRYRCFIPKLRSRVKESVIQLIVAPSPPAPSPVSINTTQRPPLHPDREAEAEDEGDSSKWNGLVPAGVCLGVMILFGGAIGYFLKMRMRLGKKQDREDTSYLKPVSSTTRFTALGAPA